MLERAQALGYAFPNIIDPSGIVSEHASLGQGVFVGKGAVVNAGATVGDGAIINTGAIVEHDCKVGAFVHIAPGAVPVSYTHLDVYKRQYQCCTVGGSPRGNALAYPTLGENVTLLAYAAILGDCHIAVSYTHLLGGKEY